MSENFLENLGQPKRGKIEKEIGEIGRYIDLDLEPKAKQILATIILRMLVFNERGDDEFIRCSSGSREILLGRQREIRAVRQAIERGIIKPEAPWLEDLNDAIIRFAVLSAGLEADLETEKGDR